MVTKIRGVRQGERGTVVFVEGGRVKVAADTGGTFIWQASRNFELCDIAPVPPNLVDAPAPKPVAAPPQKPVASAAPAEEGVNFVEPHNLTVCFWNTLKLSCLKTSARSKLGTACIERLGRKFEVDVLLLSEIPCKAGAQRVAEVQTILERATGCTYTVHFSEASGVGPNKNQPEYHVALVKTGVEVEATITHHTYIDDTSTQRPLDHAPFTVFVTDARFKDVACQKLALTSVHMPPKSRKKDMVVQAKGFLDACRTQRAWPDALRSKRPLSFAGPNRSFCTHIVGGDFNCDPGAQLDLPHSVWLVGLENAATSSGRQAYDNALLNRSATKAWMSIGTRLAGFPLSQQGKGGVSDHDAVVVTLAEHIEHRVGEGGAQEAIIV